MRDLQYLAGLCEKPRFIFHTRRSLARELNSMFMRVFPGQAQNSERQWRCFDSYCMTPPAATNPPICSVNSRLPLGAPCAKLPTHP